MVKIFKRLFSHLILARFSTARLFPKELLIDIERNITDSEKSHSAEIRVIIEESLNIWELFHAMTPKEKALKLFSHFGMWDTEKNNGILLYLLLADRDIEIIADRGFNGKVLPDEWSRICNKMEKLFKDGRFKDGLLLGVTEITELCARYFPVTESDRGEISNQPIVL